MSSLDLDDAPTRVSPDTSSAPSPGAELFRALHEWRDSLNVPMADRIPAAEAGALGLGWFACLAFLVATTPTSTAPVTSLSLLDYLAFGALVSFVHTLALATRLSWRTKPAALLTGALIVTGHLACATHAPVLAPWFLAQTAAVGAMAATTWSVARPR